eukprot:g5496.t1
MRAFEIVDKIDDRRPTSFRTGRNFSLNRPGLRALTSSGRIEKHCNGVVQQTKRTQNGITRTTFSLEDEKPEGSKDFPFIPHCHGPVWGREAGYQPPPWLTTKKRKVTKTKRRGPRVDLAFACIDRPYIRVKEDFQSSRALPFSSVQRTFEEPERRRDFSGLPPAQCVGRTRKLKTAARWSEQQRQGVSTAITADRESRKTSFREKKILRSVEPSKQVISSLSRNKKVNVNNNKETLEEKSASENELDVLSKTLAGTLIVRPATSYSIRDEQRPTSPGVSAVLGALGLKTLGLCGVMSRPASRGYEQHFQLDPWDSEDDGDQRNFRAFLASKNVKSETEIPKDNLSKKKVKRKGGPDYSNPNLEKRMQLAQERIKADTARRKQSVYYYRRKRMSRFPTNSQRVQQNLALNISSLRKK